MSEIRGDSWEKIKKYKAYVSYSNLLLIPWFLLGLYLSQSEVFLVGWVVLFLILFKVPLFFLIKKLRCPVCGQQLVSGGMSIAFLKNCGSCGAVVGDAVSPKS